MRRIICAVLCASIYMQSVEAAPNANQAAGKMPETAAPLSTSEKRRTAEYLESLGKSAQSALRAGMPSLAKAIVGDAIESGNIPKELESGFDAILVDALIAQGAFEDAKKLFAKIDSKSPADKIRSALINVGMFNANAAAADLEGISPEKLGSDELPWYFIASGYIDYERGDTRKALENFEKAKKSADFPATIADVEIAETFCKMDGADTGESPETLAKNLGEKVKIYMGTPQGFQLAKQYAAALYKLGKREEAIEQLEAQLEIELASELDKDEIRIVAAAMTKSPEKQLDMLRGILRETASPAVCDFALAMYAKNASASAENKRKFLEELLENGSEKIRDRIYLELAKAAIDLRNGAEASKFAGKLVDEFPASKYKSDALRILAWTAFASAADKLPEYRLAAKHLESLAELESDPQKAREMKLLAADCFYLNKDYGTAAKLYAELMDTMVSKRGVILNRAIESYLLRGEEKSAVELLDAAYGKSGVGDDALWNAEWKIISRFRANGESAKALARIERAAKSTRSKQLLVKMQWLLARITEESGDTQKAVERCDKIIAELANPDSADKSTREIVASNAMLMKARCLETLGKTDEAVAVYKSLQEKYPQSDAAKVSYLYNARTEAGRGNFAAAQQLCRALAESDPKGDYAYDAVSDAAQYARKVGLEADYKNALKMLDKLCADFPDSPRNFYSRLAQAEILRLLNAFPDARKLYEEIINNYQSHPEIHLAWLGLGDCVLAQPTRALNAVAIFERIYALPESSPATKAEAAFKCAYALERAGRTREANEMRWGTARQLLAEKPADAAAKYWVGRSLYALAGNLEAAGEKRDARAAYELIVKYKLPSQMAAKAKLEKLN